ncbi:MAG: TIGR00282 family metallophosphoesterase [Alphaproteobacteria bacterium]|nr:TIGR00282 family metallophosphoesterase [Alphaproteobacteria bacterium]
MRLLLCGDVVGRAGREAIVAELPRLRRAFALDLVVVNGENAAHGFGITDKICEQLYAVGCDVITTGNHVWDRREIIPYIDGDPRLLRPINFPPGTPGRGYGVFRTRDGRKVLVANAMARLFMDAIDDPFAAIGKLLDEHPLGSIDAALIDFHGEATSEKTSMGYFCDGRASAVIGTHSHVPAADYRILPRGTAYMSDVGMCGDYDSVIGMQSGSAVARFVKKMPVERLQVADGPATLCAVVVETDDASGLAGRIAPVRIGGSLTPTWPREMEETARALSPS